jgi:ribosome maturation factor RimP
MIQKDAIINIVEETIKKMNSDDKFFFIVEVIISPSNKIIVHFDCNKNVSIHDCELINRAVEGSLDRNSEDFELEISSPGLGSPFKVYQQYLKNIGQQVEVVTKDGKKTIGMLKLATNDQLTIEEEKKVRVEKKKKKEIVKSTIVFYINQIKTTKAVINFK